MGGELGSLAGPALVPQYGECSVMVARVVWGDEEAFESHIFHHICRCVGTGIQNGLKNHCPLRD